MLRTLLARTLLSRYINSDEYYYTLIRYIEQNPVEAGLVENIKDYPYTLGSVIANKLVPVTCTRHSKLLAELDYENIQDMIGIKLSDEELKTLEKIKNQKTVKKDNVTQLANEQTLEEHFLECKTLKDRNAIMLTALDDGYSQIAIANYLNVSHSLVFKVVREEINK